MAQFKNFTANYKNKSGSGDGFLSGINVGNILTSGTQIWAAEAQRKAAAQQSATQIEIERAKLELAKANRETELARIRAAQDAELAKAQAESAKAGSVVAKIRAYTIPIIVGGVVIIGGIGAYFYFKRKK